MGKEKRCHRPRTRRRRKKVEHESQVRKEDVYLDTLIPSLPVATYLLLSLSNNFTDGMPLTRWERGVERTAQ
jgi:hypothetical protein